MMFVGVYSKRLVKFLLHETTELYIYNQMVA